MVKRKTYERKGFARRFTHKLFSNEDDNTRKNKESGGSWRPRKADFRKLLVDDEASFDFDPIPADFSMESEPGEYKKTTMFQKKKSFNQKFQESDLDTFNTYPSGTIAVPKKNSNKTASILEEDSFATQAPAFDFNRIADTASFDEIKSVSNAGSIQSDPTNLFSRAEAFPEEPKLTAANLATMDQQDDKAVVSSHGLLNDSGIESVNPRRKFYQFTIDEDRESTVIPPVGLLDDESTNHHLDDETQHTHDHSFISETEDKSRSSNTPSKVRMLNDRPRKDTKPKTMQIKSTPTRPRRQAQAPTQVRNVDVPSKSETFDAFAQDDNFSVFPQTPPTKPVRRAHTQPRPTVADRSPLSPFNKLEMPHSANRINKVQPSKSNANNAMFDGWVADTAQQHQAFGTVLRYGKEKENASDPFSTFSGFHQDSFSNRSFVNNPPSVTKPAEKQMQVVQEREQALEDAEAEDTWDPNFVPRIKLSKSEDSTTANIEVQGMQHDYAGGDLASVASSSSGHHAVRGAKGTSIGSYSKGSSLSSRRDLHYVSSASVSEKSASDFSLGAKSRSSTSHVSYGSNSGKPTGLPSNAIMASMLFRMNHNVDTKAVEEKLKEKEAEGKTTGNVPSSINASDDCFSCVSAFSEETYGAMLLDAWKKPSNNLLNHFASANRKTLEEARRPRGLQQQNARTASLYEA